MMNLGVKITSVDPLERLDPSQGPHEVVKTRMCVCVRYLIFAPLAPKLNTNKSPVAPFTHEAEDLRELELTSCGD